MKFQLVVQSNSKGLILNIHAKNKAHIVFLHLLMLSNVNFKEENT